MFIFKSTVKFKLFAVDKKENVLKIAIFRKVLVLKMREMENIFKKKSTSSSIFTLNQIEKTLQRKG